MYRIYQICISVAYDQTHDHQCLTSIIKYLSQTQTIVSKTTKSNKREKPTLSLSKPMIYTSSPPLATSYQKVPRKCIVLFRLSGLVFRWWRSLNHSKDEGFC